MGCTLEDTNEKINLLLREPTTIQSERSSTDLLVALIGFFLNNCASSSHIFFVIFIHRLLLSLRFKPLCLLHLLFVFVCLIGWVFLEFVVWLWVDLSGMVDRSSGLAFATW